MKKNILIILILAFSVSAKAQYDPCESNSQTNPASPIDLRGQPFLNEISPGVPKFDWTAYSHQWQVESPGGSGNFIQQTLRSPFYTAEHYNVREIAHNHDPTFHDNKPEDGWELLGFHYGKTYGLTGTPPNQTLTDQPQYDFRPLFVLYNKITGILRVCVYINKDNATNDYAFSYIRIHPQIDKGPNKTYISAPGNYPALFSHFEVNTRPLVGYAKDLDQTFLNNSGLIVGQNEWVYADFAMSYDPCVCFFEYNTITIEAYGIDEAQIDLSGMISLSGYLDVTQKSGQASNNSWIQNIGKADKTGQTLYKSLGALQAGLNFTGGLFDPDKKAVLGKLAQSKALKAIPYVGWGLGILDFLSNGPGPDTKLKGSITTHGDINLSGSITEERYFVKKSLHVPGSIITNPILNSEVPYYNKPLGVFMMLEPPLIKYVEYRDNMSSNAPRVRQYKVDELPIFKLNPSSGLEIEEMKVSLVLDYGVQYNNVPGEFNVNSLNFTNDHNHPVIFSESPPLPGYQADPYIEYEKMGFNLEKEILSSGGSPESVRLTLGQIPIGCFENTSFYLSKEATSSEELVLKIRFNLILKEKLTGNLHQAIHIYNIPSSYIIYDEEHDDNHEFLYYATHEPESWGFETRRIIPFSNSVFSSPNSSLPSVPSYYPEKNTNILDYLIWEDEIVPEGTYKAWELISIGNNVTLQGNSSFYSYGEIFITPENQFTPEKKFSTIFPDAGCYDNPMDYNTEDVSSFCTGLAAKYDPVRNIMEPDLDLDTTPIVKSFDFKLYPNPTSRIVNVELPEMAEGGVYDITVMDIRGQVMSEMRILPSETIGSVYEMEVSHFTAGIYFVRLVIDGEAKVKRLVIL
jgi:hypothetical protein